MSSFSTKRKYDKNEYLCWKKKVSSLLLPLFSMCTRYHVGFGLDDNLDLREKRFPSSGVPNFPGKYLGKLWENCAK
jgi:hypothetical protein